MATANKCVCVRLASKCSYAQKIFNAVHCGVAAVVKKMIASGANINRVYISSDGKYSFPYYECCNFCPRITLLHVALTNKYFNIVDILIEAGANLDLALHSEVWIYYNSNKKNLPEGNIQFFLQKGADINSRIGTCNRTLLFGIPFRSIDESLTKILLKAGADVNIKDQNHCTPLHAAADFFLSKIEVLRLFLQAGAQVNVCQINGHNALGSHIKNKCIGNKHIALLLLAAGENHVDEHNLFFKNINRTLRDRCRKIIRNRLLEANSVNLFLKVPMLPLPLMLKDYLLYYQEI